ncbi:MAG: DUF11 domain-containing protein [Acidobacteria bacterium]|nr:DUF11 domain-containing protein [Acidobacteriota bacterium]
MRSNARTSRERVATPTATRGDAAGHFGARLLFALLVLLALAPAAAAQTTSIYSIRGNATAGSNNIWAINPSTGAETLVYTGYPGGNAATLAQRPTDGMLFYVINDPSGQNGAVYRFNPFTPSVAPVLLGNIGPSTSGGNVLSGFRMAFNQAGTLYYMSGGGGADNDTLYTINQATGRATPVATITGTGNGGDMAFSGNTLYIINQNRQLLSATVAGGAATNIGTVTFPGGATPGTIGLGVDGSRILITTTTTSASMYAVTLPSLSATLVSNLSGGTTATGDLSTIVVPAPDISVTKSDGLTNVYQGLLVTYTVVVTNNGTYTVSANLFDTVPASLTGVTWTCAASAGSTCDAASGSGNAISTGATLAASGTATYTIKGTVNVSSGSIANTATANLDATWVTESSAANNSATDTDTVVAAADLSITKTTSSTFTVGSNASYTLTVVNGGPQSAAGTITVTDTLPTGLTYVSATGTGWACSNSSGTVTCTRAGPVTSGTTLPAITLTVAVGAAAAPSVTNTASVSSNTTFDQDASDNSSSVTSPVTVPTDLTIAKSHTGNFTQGQSGTYSITVTNSGGVASSGTVTVTDTLPAGLTPGTATGTGWTCNTAGQTVTCTRSDALSGGASYPAISVPVNVASNSALSLTNTATVSGGNDSNAGNNSSSDPTTVNGVADLTVAKTHAGNFIQGQNGTYTITASNAGGAATSGTVTITDTLPAGLSYVSAAGTGWTCSNSSGTVTCTRADALAAGASYPAITLTVSVAPNSALSLTNTATVSGGGQTNTSNDSSSDPTTINGVADVTIAKTHSGNFTQGQNGSYTLTVSNAGGAATSGTVTVSDTLPAGLSYVSATGTGWTCGAAGQTVTCTRADALAAGASYPAITLTAAVASNSALSLTNTATVSGGGQTNTSNDSSSDPTTVNGVSDVTITKSHTGNFAQGQSGATYTLTVSNAGAAATSGTVTVTDTLPASLGYVSATGTGWACGAAGQTVTCTRATALAAGASYPAITLTVNVSTTAPSSVTNTATVSGGGQTNTSNDSSSDPTNIGGVADLTVAKTHTGNFTRGSTGSYSITVSNVGGAATSGTVTVTDTLPTGLSYVVAAGTGWTCGAVGQVVTCTRSNALASGASYPAITLTVSVLQTAAASVTNTAAASGGGQTNTANDSSSDPTNIVSSSDLSLSKSVNNPNPIQGQNVTFTLTLINAGPSDATNVAVTDLLPAGLTFVSSTPSAGTYASGTGVWSVASLGSGASATLQVVALVSGTGTITNTAEVTASDQPDPDSTPNNHVAAEDDQASAAVGAAAPPSVSLTKSVTPSGTQVPGTQLTYTVAFTNTGGSPATAFVLIDPNPATVLKINDYMDFKVGSVTNVLGGLTSVTVAYSNDNGATWTYTPASGAGGAPAGYDRNVTHIRWTFGGSLPQTAPNNSGSVSFTTRIR